MRKIYISTLSLVLALVTTVPAETSNTPQTIRQRGALLVGVTDGEPPFGFRDSYSGESIGYDVDFARAIATRLGVGLRVKIVTQGNRLTELIDGNIDLLAAALQRSEARGSVIEFSDPYLVSGQKLIARRGLIRSPEDLVGKRIGTVVGTFAEACVRGECLASIIVPFDDYIAGMNALEAGEIDAFTADEAILVDLYGGLQGGGYEIPDVSILEQAYVLGVRKGDRAFLDTVNRTIAAIQRDGEAARLRDKWFAPHEAAPLPAYGSIVRKAATRPRFLGVMLNGVLYPEARITLFALNGEQLGTGTIATVLGDEFYVDVEPRIYDLVRPGFLVAMNMTSDMAMDVLLRRKDLLVTVREHSEQQAERVQEQISREAEAKTQRAIEMDTYREKLEEQQLDRLRYYDRYHFRRRFRR